jgi:hypothetical protein
MSLVFDQIFDWNRINKRPNGSLDLTEIYNNSSNFSGKSKQIYSILKSFVKRFNKPYHGYPTYNFTMNVLDKLIDLMKSDVDRFCINLNLELNKMDDIYMNNYPNWQNEAICYFYNNRLHDYFGTYSLGESIIDSVEDILDDHREKDDSDCEDVVINDDFDSDY